jgi:predicted sulfurtransferase/predicted O-methyltransferase YrrM
MSLSSTSSTATAAAAEYEEKEKQQQLLLLSNQQLVEQRLAASRAKKEARYQSMQKSTHRNLKIKNMLYDDKNYSRRKQEQQYQSNNSNNNSMDLYAVRVSVCEELRQELKLSGREKRGRVFIEKQQNSSSSSSTTNAATISLEALKLELQSFFRALRKGSFILSASFPQLAPNGTIINSGSGRSSSSNSSNSKDFWPIDTDDDVIKTFQAADEFYEENVLVMKRPAIVIYVQRDPNDASASRYSPSALPAYLQNLSNPVDSPTMTMLSFYAFPPPHVGIHNPEAFAEMLRKLWGKRHFAALGRVYVAREGVNAQMAIPTNVLQQFIEYCNAIPELGQYMENGINIDPKPLTREEFATAGTAAARDGKAAPPFTNLHIRVRQKIVADGLNHALDWRSAGYDMPPLEWHAALLRAKEARQRQQQQQQQQQQQAPNLHGDDGSNTTPAAAEQSNDSINSALPLILDCRNGYETSVGRFDGAEPLETENFRETWDVLRNRLKDVSKDAPIMTYCTGGIRCVKVGAYLTQEMGFRNVSRLAGGIIAYDRTLKEHAPDEEALFKGTNFVFDGRLGRSITEDAMGECITCGSTTSLVSNCLNENCHKRMIQCENCRTSFHGTCSNACRHRLVNGAKSYSPLASSTSSGSSLFVDRQPREAEASSRSSTVTAKFSSLDQYSLGHSSPPPSVYPELEFNTKALIPTGAHMVSGAAQGRLLTQLASMTREGRVLEVGTFSGYATACLLEGAAKVGDTLDIAHDHAMGTRGGGGPYVMTMERDARAFDVAVAHLKVIAEHGFGENAAQAVCPLRSSAGTLDNVPSISENVVSVVYNGNAATTPPAGYQKIQVDLVHVNDALATIEEMATGCGDLQPVKPFDLVFLDADKTRLLEYTETFLSSDLLLKKGGLIVVDNVLWKGLVLEAAEAGDFASFLTTDDLDADEGERLRKNRRARKLANKLHRFNNQIVKDPRVEVLVLPLRDGMSLIRKK